MYAFGGMSVSVTPSGIKGQWHVPSLAINIVLKKNFFFNCKEHLLLLQYVSLVHKYKTIKNI
jgi:hypothetical protein